MSMEESDVSSGAHNEPYDPLNYGNLAQNVVRALMDRPLVALPPDDAFEGAGVYAIYYRGELDWYACVAGEEVPIYVGSALAAGERKGLATGQPAGRVLWNRLRQHSGSIRQAENLRIEDFRCRYLVVVPVWISLAERFLVEHYNPLWNTRIDGFGNHPPGKGRAGMKRPRWDILHPGRDWAATLNASETAEDIIAELSF